MFRRYLDALDGDEDMAMTLTIAVTSAYERRNIDAETMPWRAWKYAPMPRFLRSEDWRFSHRD